MKKWTESFPRDAAIVDYKEFNRGYNEYKSALNGGVDRTMTPPNVLNSATIQPRAFHAVNILRRGDMNVLVDPTTGASFNIAPFVGDFRGLSYNTYGGGWVTVDEFNLLNLKDGMLHWEFSSHVYNNVYYSTANPKSVSIRLLFDGTEVVSAYKLPEPVSTFRLVCDVPITSSPNTVTVQARSVSPSITENQKSLFSLLAMQHLFIGRWR